MTATIDDRAAASTTADDSHHATDAPTWADLRDLETRLDGRQGRGSTGALFAGVLAAVAVLLSVTAIGFGSRAISESKRSTRPIPAAAAVPVAPAPPHVTLTDFAVTSSSTTIAAGNVTLEIANGGKVPHELLVFKSDLAPTAYPMKDADINEESPAITKVSDGDNLDPGATQTRSVDLTKPGTYLFVCNLPGHFKAGMFSVVTVK